MGPLAVHRAGRPVGTEYKKPTAASLSLAAVSAHSIFQGRYFFFHRTLPESDSFPLSDWKEGGRRENATLQSLLTPSRYRLASFANCYNTNPVMTKIWLLFSIILKCSQVCSTSSNICMRADADADEDADADGGKRTHIRSKRKRGKWVTYKLHSRGHQFGLPQT